MGGHVLYDVDATKLSATKSLKFSSFDYIVFNFPHVGLGIKDQDRNVVANQTLISHFLQSCKPLMHEKSQVHITIKYIHPYTTWDIKKLANALDFGCVRTFQFCPELYPGYAHRRTLGFVEGISTSCNEELKDKDCKTFCFMLKKDIVSVKGKKSGESSDDE